MIKTYKINWQLFLLIFWTSINFANNCHPSVDFNLPQYVIGYGSLINEQSKHKTDPTAGSNYPVWVKGYQRSWSIHAVSPGLGTTFLSVHLDQKSSFNGVIYQLKNAHNIQKYDQREKSYCREKVNAASLTVYGTTLPEQKQIWIYSSSKDKKELSSPSFPIVQSYVDLFLGGCLQIEENFKIPHFAQQCISSTYHWPEHWINDRIFPRRPTVHESYAIKIDTLLKEMLPQQFKHIKFEKM